MAFTTYPLNYTDYDYEDAETWLATRSSGVFVKNDFAYRVTGTDTNITFGEGLAWIHNHKFAGKVFKNDSDFTVDFGVSDANYDRIDVAAIQFDKVANTTRIVAKHGEAKTNPIIPAISQTEELYELYICSVRRKAGSVYITAGDVTDLRLSKYCGLMADNVTSIDTAAIYAQVMDLIDRLEAEISGVESSAEMMLKSIYDTNNDGVVDNANMLGGQLPAYYATKGEVEAAQTAAANAVKKTGDTMTGRLTLSADPTAALHAASKQYVDNKTGKKIIWSNSSQTSSFKEQAIKPSNFNRDDYSFFIVRYRFSTSNTSNIVAVVLPTGYFHQVFMFSDVTSGSGLPRIHQRSVNFTDDNTIEFSDAYENYTDAVTSNVDNKYLIPKDIYGIKL